MWKHKGSYPPPPRQLIQRLPAPEPPSRVSSRFLITDAPSVSLSLSPPHTLPHCWSQAGLPCLNSDYHSLFPVVLTPLKTIRNELLNTERDSCGLHADEKRVFICTDSLSPIDLAQNTNLTTTTESQIDLGPTLWLHVLHIDYAANKTYNVIRVSPVRGRRRKRGRRKENNLLTIYTDELDWDPESLWTCFLIFISDFLLSDWKWNDEFAQDAP